MRIETDGQMQELKAHGTAAFPLQYYRDDTALFDNGCIEWHWHGEVECAAVLSGSVECRIGSRCLALEPGDGVFINTRVIHRFCSPNGAVMPNVVFRADLIAAQTSAVYEEHLLPVLRSGCDCLVLRRTQTPAALECLWALLDAGAQQPQDKLLVQLAAGRLWRELERLIAADPAAPGAQHGAAWGRTRAMMRYIAAHYREKLSLEQIAASAAVSKSEALRCFRLTIGTTPVRYLIDYRLSCARELLLTSDVTVLQAAAEVGMDNISYFVRSFSHRYGTTPGACRRSRAEIAGQGLDEWAENGYNIT